MSSCQELDIDFQLLGEDLFEGYGKGNDAAGTFNVDDIFDSESELKNPVFGNDLSLASALNFNSDDDFLACAPTDVYPSMVTVKRPLHATCTQAGKQQSPLHESDSGMSDTASTPSSSPHRYDPEDATHSASQTLTNMDVVLNVNIEDLDFDIDQCSTSSSYTGSPPHSHIYQNPQLVSTNATLTDELLTEEDVRQKQALEYFDTYSNQPKTLKLTKVKEMDVPEDKSRKNAIQAKINREKKKAYIKSLEEEASLLRSDNTKLKSENQKMLGNISDLEEEVEYLKSVLVNSSSLSGLLKNISNVTEVKMSATMASSSKKRSLSDDHSYGFESAPAKRTRRINENLKKAGVCLHVNGGSASLEFCAHCSKLAHKTALS